MQYHFILLGLLLVSPLTLNAASTLTLETATCSGELTTAVFDSASIVCTGDLLLAGGSIYSDMNIQINASGLLLLENMTLQAPTINLWSESLNITSDVQIIGNNITLTSTTGSTPPQVTFSDATLSIGDFPGSNLQLIDAAVINQSTAGSVPLTEGEPLSISQVPLPGSMLLLLSGLIALFGVNKQQPVQLAGSKL